MSCTACKCDLTLANTGTGCTPLMQVVKIPIMVPIYAKDGTLNRIPVGTSLSQAYFDALVNNPDASKRWYPLPEVKNIEDVRADNITEKFNDQSENFIMEGIRSFKAWIVGSAGSGSASPQLKGSIEMARCGLVGFCFVDLNGDLIVKISDDGLSFLPIQINEQSIAAMLVKYTDTTGQKLQLTFNYSTLEKDENLRMISCNEVGDAQLLLLRGLLDVFSKITSPTTSGFIANLFTNFGTVKNPLVDSGLVAADFKLYDTSVRDINFAARTPNVLPAATSHITAAPLPTTVVYVNGTAGVGATITAGTNGALVVGGVTPAIGDLILVKDQVTQTQNGIYAVTTVGDGSTKYVLTRNGGNDNTPAGINAQGQISLSNGNVTYALAENITTIGTDNIVYEIYSTPFTVSELPSGTYTFTATLVSGDDYTLVPTKNGRDYKAVVANTIIIP